MDDQLFGLLVERAAAYLNRLCLVIDNRRTGSPGNRAATDFFARTAAAFGWQVEQPAFDCLDWHAEGAELTVRAELTELADLRVAATTFQVYPSPYSPGCKVQARLAVASTLAELEAVEAAGTLLLLRDELTAGQLMPKNFPFYNPEEHQRIYRLLEEKRPAAVLTATGRDEVMVGSAYPFPMFEDGDFDIPSVYLTDVEGVRLTVFEGQELSLTIRAERKPARGRNVIARRGGGQGRLVACAHIDSRAGTPGANDNASGTAVLLLLAELLAGYDGGPTVELVALNGEDYYAAPGQKLYLEMNRGRLGNILLSVNIDDVGYHQGLAYYSLYGVDRFLAGRIRRALAGHPVLAEGPQWYQGDHMIFVQNGVPAVAVTDELAYELLATITHTAADTPDIVDPAKLVRVAAGLKELLERLAG
jgi:aminopeptidase YwaD